jgi:phosphomannomutase/CTP:molybdopterin cytidylyltransferase MocA
MILLFGACNWPLSHKVEPRIHRRPRCRDNRAGPVPQDFPRPWLRFSRGSRARFESQRSRHQPIQTLLAHCTSEVSDASADDRFRPLLRLAWWLSRQYPLSSSIRYTSAGVRVREGPLIDAVVARTAAMVALVAQARKSVFGLMITASHNPADENGVKVVRSDGGLLYERQSDTPHHVQGEYFADLLQAMLQPQSAYASMPLALTSSPAGANPTDEEAKRLDGLFRQLLARMLGQTFPNDELGTAEVDARVQCASSGLVIIGYDNRSSSIRLAQIARSAVLEATECTGIRELGLTTTPFTQYAVWATQTGRRSSLEGYIQERFVQGYRDLCQALLLDPDTVSPNAYDRQTVLQVDCAHGTGSLILDQVRLGVDLPLRVTHHHRDSQAVNHQCGAEYVHRYARPGYGNVATTPGFRMAALDGDADRLVYYGRLDISHDAIDHSEREDDAMTVYDGDWMALVLMTLLRRCVTYLSQEEDGSLSNLDQPKHIAFGCALTAYCNGTYRERIRALCDHRLLLVPTGTQYGRDVVERHFDLAVYAEPNGHVGCYVSPVVTNRLYRLLNRPAGSLSPKVGYAARCLLAVAQITNPTGSDAISLLLIIEALLRTESATLFMQRMGALRPLERASVANLQLAEEELDSECLRHASRHAAMTWRFSSDETRILEPDWAQSEIIEYSLQWAGTRFPDWLKTGSLTAFVRPSRTESVWRIRVEASSTVALPNAAQVAEDVAAFIRGRLITAFRRMIERTASSMEIERGDLPSAENLTLATFEGVTKMSVNAPSRFPTAWMTQLRSAAVVGVVLAAGQGSRFRAAYPKVTHSFCGKPMIRRLVDTLTAMKVPALVVTQEATEPAVIDALGPLTYGLVRQRSPLGTGHALYTALCHCLRDFHGDVLVLHGDNPGMNASLLQPLLADHARHRAAALAQNNASRYFGVILSGCYTSKDAGVYGRVLRNSQTGELQAIIEHREAQQRPDAARILSIREFYSGIMIADGSACLQLLGQCHAHQVGATYNRSSGGRINERVEFYATDVIQLAIEQGFTIHVHCIPESSGLLWRLEGVNTVAELEALELVASSALESETMDTLSSDCC